MKSKFLTICFSAVPGLGHLYLGLMNRGLQIMLLFGGLILFITLSNIGAFAIILPIIWFYSMFDALQHHQLIQDGIFEDHPLPLLNKLLISHKWIAYFLIGSGLFIMAERVVYILGRYFGIYTFYFHELRTFVVAFIFVFIGIRLLNMKKNPSKQQQEADDVETIEVTRGDQYEK
ncbi:hypothetical protein [Bacillus horti]|uniref:TM2 domain-containing membrane protein YozV n=1 Tax=Caldalkalibacillus horti TaxID=77523 RepID=A0ABT9W3K6_9BACI|nr:hypothetical protein [Bacillus horti]MDQ0167819.1 TM2 domain-containing membrane protein YozV [Bacillus horti]